MAVRDAASVAEAAPFAPISKRDVGPVVRFEAPGQLERLDAFGLLILNPIFHLLPLERRHALRSSTG